MVRERVALMLADWLVNLPDHYDYETRLLPYLLNFLCDPVAVRLPPFRISTRVGGGSVMQASTLDMTLHEEESMKLGARLTVPTLHPCKMCPKQKIQDIALRAISKCGEVYEAEHEEDVIERRQYGVDGDERCNHEKPLPLPFTER